MSEQRNPQADRMSYRATAGVGCRGKVLQNKSGRSSQSDNVVTPRLWVFILGRKAAEKLINLNHWALEREKIPLPYGNGSQKASLEGWLHRIVFHLCFPSPFK